MNHPAAFTRLSNGRQDFETTESKKYSTDSKGGVSVRRLFAIAMALALLAFSVAPAAAATDPHITVNDKDATAALAAVVESNELMAPVDALAKAIGAQLTVSADGREYTLSATGYSIVFEEGKTAAIVNGAVRQAPVAPHKSGDKLMVPVRFVAQGLGTYNTLDAATGNLSIMTGRYLVEKTNKAGSVNQKMVAKMLMAMKLSGADLPGGTMNMTIDMDMNAHLNNQNMLMTMKTGDMDVMGVKVPGMTMTMAMKENKLYMKSNQAGDKWQVLPTAAKIDPKEMLSSPQFKDLSPEKLQGELLDSSTITISGTETVNNVQAVKVNMYMSDKGFEKLMNDVFDSLLKAEGAKGGVAMPEMKVKISNMSASYLIDPATGFAYQSNMEMRLSISMKMDGETADIDMGLKMNTQSTPTDEAITWPADLPK